MVKFYGLKFEDIENDYHIRHLIRRGLMATDAIDDFSVDDVVGMIKSKKAQCWGWFDGGKVNGIVITQIMVYPKRKALHCFLAAGKKIDERLLEGLETLAAFGRSKGCSALRGSGRNGWIRKLHVKGFSTWSTEI